MSADHDVDLAPTRISHLAKIVRGDETVAHTVTVREGSLCADVHGGAGELTTLSSHHQAVDVLGEGLAVLRRSSRATATSGCSASNGIPRLRPSETRLGVCLSMRSTMPSSVHNRRVCLRRVSA